MKLRTITLMLLALVTITNAQETISDIDDNTYNTVTIGEQVWMQENLKTTKFNDGTEIPLQIDGDIWQETTTPLYTWCDNNLQNKNLYGAIYNGYTATSSNVCPLGWKVPTKEDFEILEEYLGGYEYAGNKMKATESTLWEYHFCEGANNSSGFSALPGGYYRDGRFNGKGGMCQYWTSSEQEDQNTGSTRITARYVQSDATYLGGGGVRGGATDHNEGSYIRCIKNTGASEDDNAITNISKSNIKIHPNPASSTIYINGLNALASIKLYNLQGTLVKQWANVTGQLNVADLPTGMYLLILQTDGMQYLHKLSKK